MIAVLNPYPTMKDSGIRWLGQVPEHWELRRIKTLLREKDKRSRDGAGLLLSLTRAKGLLPQSEASNRLASAEDLSNYKVCKPGEFVMNRMQAWSGMFSISKLDGLVSPDYSVFEAIEPLEIRHLEYLFKTPGAIDQFAKESKGIGSGFNRLYTPEFGAIPIAVPPAPEQSTIVQFLDYATDQIERYISAKKKLIMLLEEQKQVMIHDAVTGQIDVRTGKPYPAYKPSGIEWLGDVPQHWEIRRLRHLVTGKLMYGANAAAEHTRTDWPRYLRITDFSSDGKLRSETFRSLPPDVAQNYILECDDVLLARSGATAGKAFLVRGESIGACYAGYLIRARPNQQMLLPGLLFAFTQSAGFRCWRDSTLIIATIQNISAEKYANLSLPIPPLFEQRKILRFIDAIISDNNHAVQLIKGEITLLREYRTRLIADVVTGKLDVREAAASLPDLESIADGGDEEISTEPDSQQSNTTLHPPTTPGVDS